MGVLDSTNLDVLWGGVKDLVANRLQTVVDRLNGHDVLLEENAKKNVIKMDDIVANQHCTYSVDGTTWTFVSTGNWSSYRVATDVESGEDYILTFEVTEFDSSSLPYANVYIMHGTDSPEQIDHKWIQSTGKYEIEFTAQPDTTVGFYPNNNNNTSYTGSMVIKDIMLRRKGTNDEYAQYMMSNLEISKKLINPKVNIADSNSGKEITLSYSDFDDYNLCVMMVRDDAYNVWGSVTLNPFRSYSNSRAVRCYPAYSSGGETPHIDEQICGRLIPKEDGVRFQSGTKSRVALYGIK